MNALERPLIDRLDDSIRSAATALFAAQREDGSWCDTLPSAATVTAASAIALALADRTGSEEMITGALEWLRSDQACDGGWGEGPGQPTSVNATAMALAALEFLAPDDSADALRRGFARLEELGGLAVLDDLSKASLGPVCKQFFALSGRCDEHAMVRIPLELSLFPAFIRHRFCFSFPGLMSWGLMQAALRPAGRARRLVNAAAAPRALAFLRSIVEFEGPEGGFEESPLMVALVAIGLTRAEAGHDVVRHCVGYLHRTVRADGSWAVTRDLEFTVTALITVGMHDAEVADDRLRAAAAWIRGCQMARPFEPTGAPSGGWQWSQPSGWPGTLDTADGVAALAGFGTTDHNVRDGVRWLTDMQNHDGSWSYFCRNSRLPVDSPCSLMTAHAMVALREATGMSAQDEPMARAIRWIERTQRADGSMATAWYVGDVAGTGSCLSALGRLGLGDLPAARRMCEWLLAHRNPDGGWGTGPTSTVEETAWAVLGLVDASADCDAIIDAAAAWLVDRQRADGLWQPAYVGLYMNNLLFASDHFANGYALRALGRVRRHLQSRTTVASNHAGDGAHADR